MSHCHDEHGRGGHGHGHDHEHDHDHSDDITPALQNHIYEQIDFDGVRALNETTAGTGQAIVKKTWAERLATEPELASDADEQLILHVPFAGQVRLHSIHVRSSASPAAPSKVKVFANRDDLDFDNVGSAKPTQVLDLSQTSEIQDIAVKRALFNQTQSLTFFFESNFGVDAGDDDELTRIGYIGFRGDYMRLNREGIEVAYEAAARPSDHKVAGKVGAGMGSSSLDGGGRSGY